MSKTQRIYYIHTGVWPTPSPSIVFVTGTAFGLAAHAPVTLIVRNGSDSDTNSIFRSLSDTELPENLDIVRIGDAKKPAGATRFFREAARHIAKAAAQGSVKAVITRNLGFLPRLRNIQKRHGIPCLFETHDFYGDLAFRSDLTRSLSLRRKQLLERFFLPKMDGLLCLTDPQAALFRNCYPDTAATVAPTGLFHAGRGNRDRDKQFCYTGSFDPHKGISTVLTALSHTADHEIRLLIIGGRTDHEKSEFMHFADMLGVADRVRIVTWVHHSDIYHLMDSCIAGLAPLRDTPFNRSITSPLKLLDYLSRSLPVIASDLPSIRFYIEDGKHGCLAPPDNPEALADVFDRFVAQKGFETMSPAVEQHAKSFLWTERGAKILQFISDIEHNRS